MPAVCVALRLLLSAKRYCEIQLKQISNLPICDTAILIWQVLLTCSRLDEENCKFSAKNNYIYCPLVAFPRSCYF